MFDFDDLEEQEETTTAPPELVAEEGLDGDGYLAGCRRLKSLKGRGNRWQCPEGIGIFGGSFFVVANL